MQGKTPELPSGSVCDTCPTVRRARSSEPGAALLQAPHYKALDEPDQTRRLLEQGLCAWGRTRAGRARRCHHPARHPAGVPCRGCPVPYATRVTSRWTCRTRWHPTGSIRAPSPTVPCPRGSRAQSPPKPEPTKEIESNDPDHHHQPITRIEGHVSIKIWPDDAGNYKDARVNDMSLRGFENSSKASGRGTPGYRRRICATAPARTTWPEQGRGRPLGVGTPPPAGHKLREPMQTIAHAEASRCTSISWQDRTSSSARMPTTPCATWLGNCQGQPRAGQQVVKTRYMVKMILDKFSRKTIHLIAGVPGGFCKPMLEEERKDILGKMGQVLDFAMSTDRLRQEERLPQVHGRHPDPGGDHDRFHRHPWMANGAQSSTTARSADEARRERDVDFDVRDYDRSLGEHVEPWSDGKFPYARNGTKASLDVDVPQGTTVPTPRPHQCGRPHGDPPSRGGAGGVPVAVRPPGPGDPALPLRPADRGGLRLRAGRSRFLQDPDHGPERAGASWSPRPDAAWGASRRRAGP